MHLRRPIGFLPRASPSDWRMWSARRPTRRSGGRSYVFRLLAKIRLPRGFKDLRLMALQGASARVWSRLMFARFVVFDERLDECSMGFKRGHSAQAESLIFRSLRDFCLEWGNGFCALQLDCSATYDSVAHTALRDSMVSGGVRSARPSGTSARTVRACLLVFATCHPRTGAEAGVQLQPMLFRWIVQDVVLPLARSMAATRLGDTLGRQSSAIVSLALGRRNVAPSGRSVAIGVHVQRVGRCCACPRRFAPAS